MIAIVRQPSRRMAHCELTHLERVDINVSAAQAQHAGYVAALRNLGIEVVVLEGADAYPDCAFIEDTAICLNEVAVLCRPGAPSRAGELEAVAVVLDRSFTIHRIEAPATLDGGDVLRVGRRLFVGLSSRTNQAGVEALAAAVFPLGYEIMPVRVQGALHLKTAITEVAPGVLVANPDWVDLVPFEKMEILPVDTGEPFAANTLAVGGVVLVSAAHARTSDRLRRRGIVVVPIEISEFAKAEAGLTCLSLLLP